MRIAVDQRDQLVRGQCIQLDAFATGEDVDLLLGRAVPAQCVGSLAGRGDVNLFPLQTLDVRRRRPRSITLNSRP
jgi:hypothetical protein